VAARGLSYYLANLEKHGLVERKPSSAGERLTQLPLAVRSIVTFFQCAVPMRHGPTNTDGSVRPSVGVATGRMESGHVENKVLWNQTIPLLASGVWLGIALFQIVVHGIDRKKHAPTARDTLTVAWLLMLALAMFSAAVHHSFGQYGMTPLRIVVTAVGLMLTAAALHRPTRRSLPRAPDRAAQ
jgi:hypothetical protein